MVVVLTSNYNAAMLQLAFQMRKEFRDIIGAAIVFVPDQASLNEKDDVELYSRKSSLLPFDKQYSIISERIKKYNPSLVYVCDTNLITSRIVLGLPDNIPVCMTVHDVESHPSYKSLSVALKEKIKKPYLKRALKRANRIILMSNHSFKEFEEKNPQFGDKLSLIKLGAHVPNVASEQPPELVGETNFILFFGRLDKYKGLINLLKAYEIGKNKINQKIVIAGRGTLTEDEQILINTYPEKIILVKRYISDGEMIWLFKNAICTVLPYIEASQSGVLSMTYHFGKPVIVSDLEGLTEFVDPGKTGFVFHSIEELSQFLIQVPKTALDMYKDIQTYYNNTLNWEKNIKDFISKTDFTL